MLNNNNSNEAGSTLNERVGTDVDGSAYSRKISDLPKYIYSLFSDNKVHTPNEDNLSQLKNDIGEAVVRALSGREDKPTLRMSNLGRRCERQLWYSINKPELAEPISPRAKVGYLYGHILEAFMVFLTKEAGYKVEGQQDERDIKGVKGHIDAIVNGVLVDFKAVGSRSYSKFKDRVLAFDDPFGYIDQLRSYLWASKEDDRVVLKDKTAFVAIDRSLGNICVDPHELGDTDYDEMVDRKREMLSSEQPPPRAYTDEEDGKSGNRKLGVACSYCPYKKTCWPGLRVFNYSGKPRFLTKVVRRPAPHISELDLDKVIS